MGYLPLPHIMKDSIFELSPRVFTNRGVRLILLDVDNTLAAYGDDTVSDRLFLWVKTMQAAGLDLFILSNNRGGRPEAFARRLGLGYEKKAFKPFTKTAKRVLAELGVQPRETALIGDQIYTDVLCARSLGALAVLVRPIRLSNFLLRLRYGLEAPFRRVYRGKRDGKKKK